MVDGAKHSSCLISDFDPFCRKSMIDPYPEYGRLRTIGPIARLEKYGVWAISRFSDVNAVLSNSAVFSSAGGTGLANYFKQKPWRTPSLLLETDPPLHTRTRAVVVRTMTPIALRKLQDGFRREAETLVEKLIERGNFDAVRDLAEVFPLSVFPQALGIDSDNDEMLLTYGAMVFAIFGPEDDYSREAMLHAPTVLPWIELKCRRDALRPDGFGAQIYEAVDTGEITPEEAPLLVRSFLSAGLDTTISGIGMAINCFVRHPEQWAVLTEDPSLARSAFDEVLRFQTPGHAQFRTTTDETDYAGVRIAKHEKVMLLMASANRDEARWEEPDAFDIRRKPGHIAFGTGIHTCAGQMLARMEGEALLKALASRVKSIELAGEPVWRPTTALRVFSSLPVSVQAK